MISRATTAEVLVALEEGHLPGQIRLVTSVVKREIYKKYCRSKGNGSGGNPPRSPQMSFHNGLPRSLLFQIPNILQQSTLPATRSSTSGSPLAIMVRVHGDFTGRMATSSGKISKARSHQFVFPILLPMQ